MKARTRESSFYRSLGKSLRSWRERFGISQAKLADRLGESRTTVTKWEGGTYRPTPFDLVKIGKVYGATIGELFHWMEE